MRKCIFSLLLCVFLQGIFSCYVVLAEEDLNISTEISESQGIDDHANMYRAYYDKLMELQAQYGETLIVSGYSESWILGLCFAKLVDFNNDDHEELVLAYLSGLEHSLPKYVLEVYAYDNGEIKRIFEGNCFRNESEGYTSVTLCYYQNQYFLLSSLNNESYSKWWDEDISGQSVSGTAGFSYRGDEFVPVHSSIFFYFQDYSGVERVDGVDLPFEELYDSEEYQQWIAFTEEEESFSLASVGSYGFDETLAELDSTLTALRDDLGIDSEEEPRNPGWKQAYIQYIQEVGWGFESTLGIENFEFYLLDINGDEIPELLVEFLSTAGGGNICTYDGEKLNSLHTWNYGFSYIPGSNLFCDSGGHMDGYYDHVYSIENGQFVEFGAGEFGAEDNSKIQLNADGSPVYQYFWNEREVDESTYDKMLNNLYAQSEKVSPYDNDPLQYMEVLATINMY